MFQVRKSVGDDSVQVSRTRANEIEQEYMREPVRGSLCCRISDCSFSAYTLPGHGTATVLGSIT